MNFFDIYLATLGSLPVGRNSIKHFSKKNASLIEEVII